MINPFAIETFLREIEVLVISRFTIKQQALEELVEDVSKKL
jgi:hypothetical protein